MSRTAARASDPVVQEAAQLALSGSNTALHSVLTGFFAAAGNDAGVLFSPVSLLLGGLGSGAFAYDGRCRQPGREAKRPRGFEHIDDVPDAARVAVPASIAALSVACAFQPGTSLLASSRPGVAAAKALGAKGRADIIDRVAGLGASFLSDSKLKKLLLNYFGPTERGCWGPADLIAPDGLQSVARAVSGEASQYLLPWAKDEEPADADGSAHPSFEVGQGHAIIAVDGSGLFAALSYRVMPGDVRLEEYQVELPRLARPVMRGVTRTTPGEVLPTPADLRLERDERGHIFAVSARPSPFSADLRLIRDNDSKEVFADESAAQ